MLSMAKNDTRNSSYDNDYGVSSKKFQQGQQQTVVVELGLKLNQQQQDHHRRADVTDHHNNHDDHDNNQDDDVRCGATTCNGYNKMMMMSSRSSPINSVATPVAGDSTSSVHSSSTTTTRTPTNPSSVSVSGGVVRGLQPSDAFSSYYYSPPNPFFKSSGGMATTAMGYPFTVAQLKELERQAMIYKYMMASLPVPPNLLYSSLPTNFTFAPASYFMGKYGSGITMRWSGNSKDAEPGRCRRTDGKKWRCSRDVAPNQKYCERHMHRGRPRSRKHVEQQQQQTQHYPISNLSFTNNSNNNDNITPTKKTRLSSDVTTHSVQQPCSKAPFFSHPLASSTIPFDDSRNLGWTEEQQWNQLVQTNNMNSSVFQQQYEGEPLNLISHGGYNTKCEDMGLLERPLIDAWSMGVTSGSKDNVGIGNKLSISSSNGGNNANTIDEEMCRIHMGLGLIDSWVGSNTTPGGPLAEVLRPGNPAMTEAGESEFVTPPATAVSSPSGVLQKTLATFSDSSGNNSPTTTCHNSKPLSDIPFRWLN